MVKKQVKRTQFDAVFIRKSSKGQEEQGQIDNVTRLLENRGVAVDDERWFKGTVSRRKIKTNAEFIRLLRMVEAGELKTIYVESQDRLGMKDSPELFWFIGELRQRSAKLIDLTEGRDLTEEDFVTEIMVLIGGHKSQKELRDTARRSLRSRVNNFKANGSWPTGTHPFGYGKACYAATGELKWVWHPVSRGRGQTFAATCDGRLVPGVKNQKLPRKEKTDRIVLVPNNNERYVEAVKLVFDLYTRAGLSRRKISARLNSEGYRFYGKYFTHPYVTQILTNPAYTGDTHFGKHRSGELYTFDGDDLIVKVERYDGICKRAESERIIKENTHEPLVDRKTWKKAQDKFQSEQQRTSYAPRNPAYYLKPIFVCGHCGRNMTGRMENGKSAIYICSSYISGRSNGHESPCGYHRISHKDAEQLLLDKIKELDLAFDPEASEGIRQAITNEIECLEESDEAGRELIWRQITEGVSALVDYFKETYELSDGELRQLKTASRSFYRFGKLSKKWAKHLPLALREFKTAVGATEKMAVADAQRRLAELIQEHESYTKAWVKASDMQQAVIKRELDQLEAAIKELKPRTMTVSDRLAKLYDAEDQRSAQRRELLTDWPTLENRERGEALRQLFNTVTLYWEAKWRPSPHRPARERKTDREGRFSYSLLPEHIEWDLADFHLAGSSSRTGQVLRLATAEERKERSAERRNSTLRLAQ